MSLLDKLLEKKDIMILLKTREQYLVETMRENILSQPLIDREKTKNIIIGHIRELRVLRDIIHQGEVKTKSKWYWNQLEFHKKNTSNKAHDALITHKLRDKFIEVDYNIFNDW